jgi:hypothetical protein
LVEKVTRDEIENAKKVFGKVLSEGS